MNLTKIGYLFFTVPLLKEKSSRSQRKSVPFSLKSFASSFCVSEIMFLCLNKFVLTRSRVSWKSPMYGFLTPQKSILFLVFLYIKKYTIYLHLYIIYIYRDIYIVSFYNNSPISRILEVSSFQTYQYPYQLPPSISWGA